jgi:hypothetical protein
LTPTIEGEMYNFVNSGLYDGLFVLEDKETRTLWSHMTGEALYGEHLGLTMPVSNLLQLSVSQALAMDADVSVSISDRPYNTGDGMSSRWSPTRDDVRLMSEFVETLGEEDNRLDRMEMGLGIWSDNMRRYYPLSVIRDRGRYLVDEVDGQKLLVFLDPLTSTPTAVYWDTDEVTFEGRNILLENGHTIVNGQVTNSAGEIVATDRPQQMYSRWYGFSLTFPDPEIIQ